MQTRWMAALLVLAALGGPAAAQQQSSTPSLPRNGSYQPSAPEALRIAQRQLQVAAMRLQKAKDFGGQAAAQQLQDGRQVAEQAMRGIDQALTQLQQSQETDEARQAIRNARLELQSAKEALAGVQPDSPEAAIQALRDLDRAALEVQSSAQVAERPGVADKGRAQ